MTIMELTGGTKKAIVAAADVACLAETVENVRDDEAR